VPRSSRKAAGSLIRVLEAEGVPLSTSLARRRACSRDHSWLSPILSAELPDRPGDAVVSVRSVEELAKVVSCASRFGVPLTLRGRGTGNYGQAVPLEGGLVVDTLALNRIVEVSKGQAVVEPGASCQAVKAAARECGQELAVFPSTVQSTIGGFVAGGAGGVGSLEHGWVWDGLVKALEVVHALDRPHVEAISGADAGPYLHAYGTTGALATLSVRLVPARQWVGLFASFADFVTAVAVGEELLVSGIALRLLGVTDPGLASMLDCPGLEGGRASLRAVVAAEALSCAETVLRQGGGRVDGAGEALVKEVISRSFNHVTLRAKRRRRDLCHLQLCGEALTTAAARLRGALPKGGLHLDAMATASERSFAGLLLGRFPGRPAFYEAAAYLADNGVKVIDAHTWRVPDPDGSKAKTAVRVDPLGILNPGKLTRS